MILNSVTFTLILILGALTCYVPPVVVAAITNCDNGRYYSCTYTCSCGTSCKDPSCTLSEICSCQDCPIGYYKMGAVSVHACDQCEPGKYQDEVRKEECKNCLAGYYLPMASAPGTSIQNCSACSNGRYQAEEGADSCSLCSPGLYENGQASSLCKNCPAGMSNSNVEQTECTQCIRGKYQNEVAQIICKYCATGSFGPTDGADSTSACISCAPGKYSNVPGITESSSCAGCSGGRYSTEEGRNSISSCKDCPTGWHNSNIGQILCTQCEPGKYQNDTAQTNCKYCGAGKYSSEGGQSAETSCKDCPAGRYSPVEGLFLENSCINCAGGRYSILKGATSFSSCKVCPSGFFTLSEGDHTFCNSCPSGFYNAPDGGSISCTNVPPGNYLSQTELKVCSAGNFCTGGSANESPCDAGQFSAAASATCTDCGKGRYSAETATECISCVAAKYNPNVKQHSESSCLDCPAGYYSTELGSSSCSPCGKGKYNDQNFQSAESSCKSCPAGKFSSAVGVSSSGGCNDCSPGKYSKETGNVYSSKCNTCITGFFQNLAGNTTCIECPTGWGNTGSGSTGCNAVPPGSYTDNGIQDICQRGYTCSGADSPQDPCPKGKYTNITGSVSCVPCSPGKYSDIEGSTQCKYCPSGYLQPEPEQAKCDAVPAGAIVAKGGSASVVVPQGSKINASEPSGFVACPAGTKGNIPPNETCTKCRAGESSAAGATSCHPCDKGKFSNAPGSTCQDCPVETFQDQNTNPSTSCKRCPAGWTQPILGSPSCTSLNWKTRESCKDTEYLNDTAENPSQWTCDLCPIGGDCSGPVIWNTIQQKFGWWKIPKGERESSETKNMFAKCLYPPACIGAPNKDFEGVYMQDDGVDLALISSSNATTPCSIQLGFKNYSRLCQTCMTGYSRTSKSTCTKCVDSGGWLVITFAVTLMTLFFVGLNIMRIHSFRVFNAQRRRKSLHSSIKRTLLSHIQMVSITLGLTVPWPDLLERILIAASSVASFSEGVNSFECYYKDVNHAKFYNNVLLVAALGPFLLAMFLAFYWFVLVRFFNILKCGTNIRKTEFRCTQKNVTAVKKTAASTATTTTSTATTNKGKMTYSETDAFISSAVLLWFLILPSLLRIGSSALKCWKVGNNSYVLVDLEKVCFIGEHLIYSIFVALPMIIFFALIVPGYLLLQLRHAGPARLTDPSLMLRWGILHSGYREEKYWWEMIVLLRKYLIIALVTFNNRGEFQLHIALGVLILALHVHDSQHPFGHRHIDPVNSILHRYEMASLLVLLFMLWCADFFSLDLCRHEPFSCTLLVLLILVSNFALVGLFMVKYCQEFCKRQGVRFSRICFMQSSHQSKQANTNSNSSNFVGIGEATQMILLNNTNTSENDDQQDEVVDETVLNPMTSPKKNASSSNNNNNALVPQEELDTNSTASIEILYDDVSGRKYSYNRATGERKWQSSPEDEEKIEIHEDEYGHKYSYNLITGETAWL